MRLVALLAFALVACKVTDKSDKSDKGDKSDKNRESEKAGPERPSPEPQAMAPVPIDQLLAWARSKAGADQAPWHIAIDYVRSDGMIDPAFGEVEVWFGAPAARDPADDPLRPTGAPVRDRPKPPPPKCHHLSWRAGVWSDLVVGCSSPTGLLAVRCTVPIIWERAIAKGAPRDAVAKVSIRANKADAPRWSFRIDDEPRNVHFRESFPDDCGLVAEAPDPTVGPDTMPDGLDRTMVQNTIGTVKAQVMACADIDNTKGMVKISAKVAPDGSVTATVRSTPSAKLGTCVLEAVLRAKFPATRDGGTFGYPFMF